MTTTVLKPASGDTAPWSGEVRRTGVNETFSTIRAGAGTLSDSVNSSGYENVPRLNASATTDQFDGMYRGLVGFAVPDLTGESIDSFTIQLFDRESHIPTTALGDANVEITAFTPASESAIADEDFNLAKYGATKLVTGLSIESIRETDGYVTFTGNAAGIAYLEANRGNNVFFAIRLSWDVDNSFDGTWSSGGDTLWSCYLDGVGKEPTLTIESSVAAATSHVATLTIDKDKVPSDLTDYVVEVDLSDLPSAFWDVVVDGGGDIRVFKDDDATELAREVVFCETTGDTGKMFIKYAGTLSASVDTDIHIHADGAASEPAADATYGSQNVWTNYVAVLHFQDNALDSSPEGNNFTATAVTYGADKVVGKAVEFSGTSDRLTKTHNASLALSEFTYQMRLNGTVGGNKRIVWKDVSGNNNGDFQIRDNGFAYFQEGVSDITLDFTMTASTWQSFAFRTDSSDTDTVLNGVQLDTVATAWTPASNALELLLGNRNTSDAWTGDMSEFRICKTKLSDAHLKAEHDNWDSPSTFYAATAAGAPVVPVAPTVTTQAVTDITTVTATGNGNVTDDGNATITERGVCYSTSASPTIADNTETAAGTTGAFTASLTGLTADTTYYVRAYAVNSETPGSASYGAEVSFTTAAVATAPSVTSSAASGVTDTAATLNGEVTDDGGDDIDARGFVYALTAAPDLSDTVETVAGTVGVMAASITGLTADTTYYVRPYATNGVGTTYGTQITFTTTSTPVAAETCHRERYWDGSEWVIVS